MMLMQTVQGPHYELIKSKAIKKEEYLRKKKPLGVGTGAKEFEITLTLHISSTQGSSL